MTTIHSAQQPGSAIAIFQEKIYIGDKNTITIYNDAAKKVGLIPDLEQQILFLGILKASGTLIAATKDFLYFLETDPFVDVETEEAPVSLLRKVSVTHTLLTCGAERVIVATASKLFTFGSEEEREHSIQIKNTQHITALCEAKMGFVSAYSTGQIKFSPCLLFQSKQEKITCLGTRIDALTCAQSTLFALTGNVIVSLNLDTQELMKSYPLNFSPTTLLFQQTLLAIGSQQIFFPLENKPFEFLLRAKQLGDIQSVTGNPRLLAIAGSHDCIFVTLAAEEEPQIAGDVVEVEPQAAAAVAVESKSWWSSLFG